MDLAVSCYGETRGFPATEAYGLTSQIRRAAASILANIAEGFGRETTGAFIQFLRVAQGSLKELETHVMLAERVDLLRISRAEQLLATCEKESKMLRSLIRSLQLRADSGR